MLTTVLDLLGLACAVAAVLLVAAIMFGAIGLAAALGVLAAASLGASWLVDRIRS